MIKIQLESSNQSVLKLEERRLNLTAEIERIYGQMDLKRKELENANLRLHVFN
ncbi:hypothetical protein DDB_G0293430 [Dictyostelium discoideum AX4]|uniref:Putative uncharacterized protein DDB_G0293430 n=1 Tax=Dictyostelium discoideum TaxID=44689 RepID=Y1934_DICDI|nr:hypothetical protein DDB_G0293430 [Dictyostelium discoideum AX4]Q54BT9.1 RecName: Full=Putative uncharacterized protein DDB_G0293430 [Dictyostelium discoideum]EAL60727.1 hypothetical protein DDB_G0293430 [Dictyostelium discoideum AX4]|eukprot:XP_629140.1 hypothetical protein DDB_G0293430 [Dictyostelium discoideum AX4]